MNTARAVLVTLCCLILLTSSCSRMIEADVINGNIERGNTVVEAIKHYQEDHGSLPEQLDILLPDYLSEIPKTITGGSYTFTLSYIDIYMLCFDVPGAHPGCCYLHRHEAWDCSYGD